MSNDDWLIYHRQIEARKRPETPSHSQILEAASIDRMLAVWERARKRNVFISHFSGHKAENDRFLSAFSGVFTRKSVGAYDDDNQIESWNPEYTLRVIRERYIADSTVTIVLVGSCTHSRRYVDWEIKASLQQGGTTGMLPNGLIGIQMPSAVHQSFLPERFKANWNQDGTGYARFYRYPHNSDELRSRIEDAFMARTKRAHLIKNSHDSMCSRNSKCKVCGCIH